MNDLTILYYSACRLSEPFATNVRVHLREVSAPGLPIISVTHQPVDLGENICVGDLGISAWNIYWQILKGAKAATTPFVACAEDDCLYSTDHFRHRPPHGVFWYDMNRWTLDSSGVFYYRERTGMCMCIAHRALLVEALEERFAKYPEPFATRHEEKYLSEPGRYENHLGVTVRQRDFFRANAPSVVFNHRPSLGGRRRINPTDIVQRELPPWGEANALWKRITHG